ncbi:MULTISPECIES: L-fucose:H+ symporter permease [Emticicia]|uniref:L-fucose:H+ symporter permease n=1 Tax=Emticicia TaxID=312278 RepID=UPI0020A009FD|nr:MULTISPECIES: L-fucose:H+ symporter permease [Emticicia]UTA68114.1 L-fucose:H+ symporter permease [Emticicia sp. 21SJ11W-3]
MASISGNKPNFQTTATQNNYLVPFILVTSLFFLWGFAISMLDVLNKHFQETLSLTISQSTWVQIVTYGAYFLMALPAGMFMKKWGYKKGILAGLLLYSGGAFLVYPASEAQSWTFFLISLFILACGLAFLETAANPYATVLGPAESSERRLNLAQSFNGLGVIIGPLVGSMLVFSEHKQSIEEGFKSVQLPYMIVGGAVLLIALMFLRTPMPEIQESASAAEDMGADNTSFGRSLSGLFRHKHFVLGAFAQFLNVGVQGCVWGLFINFVMDAIKVSNIDASRWLSLGMIIFMVGRFAGTFLMRYIKPNILLGIYSLGIVASLLVASQAKGQIAVNALMAFFFFQSITFPTIFSLGVKDLGKYTKLGSSFIIMGIVGGAAFPPIMGAIADSTDIATSLLLPVAMFAYIAWYGFSGSKVSR